MKRKTVLRLASPVLIAALMFFSAALPFAKVAQAAALSSISDTQTDETTGVLTSNDIQFTTSTTIPLSGKIVLTYNNATSLSATLATADVALAIGGSAQLVVAGAADATHWGFVRTSSTVYTITAPSSGSTAGAVLRIKIGTAAGGTNRITNGTAGTTVLSIATTDASSVTLDSGSLAIPILTPGTTGDQVTVTATVSPTISFTLTTVGGGVGGSALNAVDFGTLSSSAARYATAGAASGGSASSATAANDLVVATNATAGYTLTYTAPATLTDGSHPITAVTLTGTNTGSAGSSQFAMNGSMTAGTTTGSPAVVSSYRYNSTAGSSNWNFATGTTTTLASNGASTTGDAVSMRYLANIPGSQAPGSYAVTITFIATGNF